MEWSNQYKTSLTLCGNWVESGGEEAVDIPEGALMLFELLREEKKKQERMLSFSECILKGSPTQWLQHFVNTCEGLMILLIVMTNAETGNKKSQLCSSNIVFKLWLVSQDM